MLLFSSIHAVLNSYCTRAFVALADKHEKLMAITVNKFHHSFSNNSCHIMSHATLGPGAYHNKTDQGGLVLPNHELFSSVVATILVIVVTAQVIHREWYGCAPNSNLGGTWHILLDSFQSHHDLGKPHLLLHPHLLLQLCRRGQAHRHTCHCNGGTGRNLFYARNMLRIHIMNDLI